MKPDRVEIHLKSQREYERRTASVSTSMTAQLGNGGYLDENTLCFDCDPIGSNYSKTYLQVTFDDWSTVSEIRDFLAYHLSDIKDITRTLTVPINEGQFIIRPTHNEGRETEDFEEITLRAKGTRVEFGGQNSMRPHIFTYEEHNGEEPQDETNVEKLLDFFDEITSDSFIPHSESDSGQDIHRLSNQYGVTARLNTIAGTDSEIYENYQKAVDEFKERDYRNTVRDLGVASEELIDRLSHELYEEDDISDRTGGRLSTLVNSADGIPSYIGKTLSAAWWLRNKASHNSDYKITRTDAQYSLLCFQIAVETYVEDFLEAEVNY